MAANKNIKINLDYSDFSGGIKECQSKMTLLNEQFRLQQAQMGNNADEVDRLALQESKLSQSISLQEQVVSQLLSRWSAMAESDEATLAQTEKAHAAWLKASTALEQMKNELDETREKMDDLSESEQRAGEESNNAGDSVQGFANKLVSAIGTISSFASAISGAINAISNVARSAATAGDDILTMATKYGVSADTMSAWIATAELTDVSAQTLGSSMSKLVRQMEDAASGSSSAQAKFEQLGVKVTDASGNLRNTETVFYEIINALGQMDNASARDAAAMDLLGKSAQDLNPIINMGVEAFQELQSSTQNVISAGMAENLNEVSDAFAQFDNAIEYGNAVLVNGLAPAIEATLGSISNMDAGVLGAIAGLKMMFDVFTSLAPAIQTFASLKTMAATASMASAGASTADTAAKTMEAGATEAATAANVGFIASLVMAAPAIAELLLSAAALVAALAAVALAIAAIVDAVATLAQAIEKIIELFKADKEATDAATDSALRYSSARSGLSTSSSSSGSNTSYMATGSTEGGAGGLTWVGEQGPELVKLPYGSTVYNNEQSTNMTKSTNVFNVTIDAKNVTDFNRVVNIFSGLSQSMNRGGLVNG